MNFSGHRSHALGVLAVVLAAVAVNIWTLNSAHYFYADDWGWLERVAFGRWNDLLRVFPQQIYNDRPSGEVFIFLMFRIFGLDSHPYNVLWLALHVFNCLVFLALGRRVLPDNRAFLAAVLAAAWYSTLIAVHWIGAIFDLAGATWCLLCLLFYLKASDGGRAAPWFTAASVLMLVLAIRCKEFAVVMVVVLASWEFLVLERRPLRDRIGRLAPHILVTLVYGLVYWNIYRMSPSFVSGGIYQVSLSIPTVLENAGYYFAQAFYLPDKWAPWGGYVALTAAVLIGCTSRVSLAGLISATALMAAVLVMPQQKNALYLYAPHFFMAISLCAVRLRDLRASVATAILVALLVAWPFYSHDWKWSRDFYLTTGGYSENLANDYVRLMYGEPVPEQLTIGVRQTYFDPFSWGHGAFLRIHYHDPRVKADVVKLAGPDDDICALVDGLCLVERDGQLVKQQ